MEKRRYSCKTTLGGRKLQFFSAFGVYIVGSFRNKVNIIAQEIYLVPHWLSTDPKITDNLDI